MPMCGVEDSFSPKLYVSCVQRICIMYLAEPKLYWRVKLSTGKWMYVPAVVERNPYGRICGVRYPDVPEVNESE